MKETFKSKVGAITIIAMCIIVGAFVSVLVLQAWPAVVIVGLVVVFILHMFFTTDYTIVGNELKVRSGFIINKTINIDTITKIVPTNNMLSSPALSLDRLEIFYNKYDSIMVSPRDKDGFVARLKGVNEGIVMA